LGVVAPGDAVRRRPGRRRRPPRPVARRPPGLSCPPLVIGGGSALSRGKPRGGAGAWRFARAP